MIMQKSDFAYYTILQLFFLAFSGLLQFLLGDNYIVILMVIFITNVIIQIGILKTPKTIDCVLYIYLHSILYTLLLMLGINAFTSVVKPMSTTLVSIGCKEMCLTQK